MKTPPLLMAAVLLFWGWQSDLLLAGLGLGLLLESARVIPARWEMTDAEIIRIWNFCSLLGLAAAIYAFTSNEGPADFGKMFEHPDLQTSQLAGNASTAAAIGLIRWLPLVFYFFMLTQAFSARGDFPLDALSPFLRYRRKWHLQANRPPPRVIILHAAWPYFMLCLFAASAHAATDLTFFWGTGALLAWALWSQRPPGFTRLVWLITLGVVLGSALVGQRGLGALNRLTNFADNYNAQWMARFMRHNTDPEQSRTSIGRIGEQQMSSQIVLRVAPVNGTAVPTHLREATYRVYHAPVWYTSGTPNDFTSVPETPVNSGHWVLHPKVAGRALVNISCYLNAINPKDGNPLGVLPLPGDCDHLENLNAYDLKNNSVGTVLAEGPGLLTFNAGFGAGSSSDEPPATNNPPEIGDDLVVPDKEKPALDAFLAQVPLAGLGDRAKGQAIDHYFGTHFEYSIWQEPPKASDRPGTTNETAVGNFLLHTHKGHCEFFATATVLLLRELGIPARYAVGYYVHETAGSHYVVRERDAHAWCLVWDAPTRTWVTLDTTPGSWVDTERKRISHWQVIADGFSWMGYQFAKFRWGQSHIRPYLLALLIPALGYFLYQIIAYRRRHQPAATTNRAVPVNWPGRDSEFYELEAALAQRGLPRRPGESLTSWLDQVTADPAVAGFQEPLRRLVRLHYRHRFDPPGLTGVEREALRREARECLKRILPAK